MMWTGRTRSAGSGPVGLLLLSCLAAVGCGGDSSPTSPELPAEEIYLGQGSAVLSIYRTTDLGAGGHFELETELTLYTDHGLEATATAPKRVRGYADTEAVILASGTGTSHTMTALIPVEYRIDGTFYPAPRYPWQLQIVETPFLDVVLPDGTGCRARRGRRAGYASAPAAPAGPPSRRTRGVTIVTRVPPPRRLSISNRPPSVCSRSRMLNRP